MTEPLSTDRPGKLLSELCRLVAERFPAEVDLPASFAAQKEAIQKQSEEARRQNVQRYEKQKAATEEEYESVRGAIVGQLESERSAARSEYDRVRDEIIARFEAAQRAEKDKLQEARWEATTVFEAMKDGPVLRLKELETQLKDRWEELQAIRDEAVHLLQRRLQWREYPEPRVADAPAEGDPMERFTELASQAKSQWRGLVDQIVPRFFEGLRPLGIFVLVWLTAIYPSGRAVAWAWYWVPLSGVAALVLLAAMGGWVYHLARKQTAQAYMALRRTLAEADRVRRIVLQAAKANSAPRRAALVERLSNELKRAEESFSRALSELERRKQDDLGQADEKYPARFSEIAARRDRELQDCEGEYSRRLREVEQRYQSESDRLLEQYSREMADSQQRFDQQWGAMAGRWQTGMERFASAVEEMNLACDRLFPDWNVPEWNRRVSPTDVPPVIRFGQYEADLNRIDGGVPRDERLRPAKPRFSMPALLPFPDRSTMLLKASGAGRARAVEILQATMLRILTSIPPGKVRFMIIDPVGLGENFSAFAHLTDYDEQLVSSRIWTDSAHIERRLTDLTEHMENVIQLYLRNEFQSIQEYNRLAGEMAEPYRVLVAANFPANFSEAAARRLVSIVASGARCGVYALLGVDTNLQLPRDFDLADLRPHALELDWDRGRFVWEHPDFGKLPLAPALPPAAERFTEIVRCVGREVKDADRVEVPFQCIVPDDRQWWSSDSRGGIDLPLGRAGAMKLQHLRLGKGTSQHVLISGKTGSGKSTLLHALITSLALRYDPDQVELYLVDFKKGVEFKTYASLELPHARVIAIESEREFGLSVLERLDLELKHRGDRFRSRGVQDLKAFRAAEPNTKLPRVLLIIDEFQELFVEDDRIAQDAALLLDRLVRQGRAFGIHVLLGSQTLAGAYTLARSTIGQMAVRIALQCSEADAHLILSEENTAARLLTRPGEAIYNDANGQYEGNHPFQVAWLPEDERKTLLQRVRQLADTRNCTPQPPVVFEGNVAADPGENRLLRELLEAPRWPETARAPQAWLGAAVAIKDPTRAEFSRHGGSNLLVVGHREEASLGVLATCFLSLAAQAAPSDPGADPPGPQFSILDGTRPDAPEAGFWTRLAAVVPHRVKVAGVREAGEVIGQLAEELARREQAERDDTPPAYLIIYNLSRFRDLRKAEEDFGLSRFDEQQPLSPARQFGKILADGPAWGIHTLLWCDTYNSVNRFVDRQGLRDLELRVVFQTNATDSSNLIDSPAASRLGVQRAILYHEGLGQLEKFRPYRPPSEDWLAWVKAQLQRRSASTSCSGGDAFRLGLDRRG